MPKLESARHHWWPECVSRHWADSENCVFRLTLGGKESHAHPKKFGAIRNGHQIKFSDESPWNDDFEQEFAQADKTFTKTINWLTSLERLFMWSVPSNQSRFHPIIAQEERLQDLVECLVSLAVRSPMNRERAVAPAENLRGLLPKKERNRIIAANMKHCQHDITRSIGTRGKFVVLFSPYREFIFGDGFFNDVVSPLISTMGTTKILAPLTPEISILYAKPMTYRIEPRMTTVVLSREESLLLNEAVQIYSKKEIFYRSEKPKITEFFQQAQYLCYRNSNNPIDNLIREIPGVHQPELLKYASDFSR